MRAHWTAIAAAGESELTTDRFYSRPPAAKRALHHLPVLAPPMSPWLRGHAG